MNEWCLLRRRALRALWQSERRAGLCTWIHYWKTISVMVEDFVVLVFVHVTFCETWLCMAFYPFISSWNWFPPQMLACTDGAGGVFVLLICRRETAWPLNYDASFCIIVPRFVADFTVFTLMYAAECSHLGSCLCILTPLDVHLWHGNVRVQYFHIF